MPTERLRNFVLPRVCAQFLKCPGYRSLPCSGLVDRLCCQSTASHLANHHRFFDQNLVKIEEHINTGDLQSNNESKLGSRLVFGHLFFVPAPIFIDSWPWQRATPPPSDLPWDRSKLKKQRFSSMTVKNGLHRAPGAPWILSGSFFGPQALRNGFQNQTLAKTVRNYFRYFFQTLIS